MKGLTFKKVAIGIGLFLFFLVVLFPYRNLKGYIFGKIHEQAQVLILAEDLSPVFIGWPGFSMSKFSLAIPMDGRELEIQGDKLVMRVGLGGVFPPRLSKSLKINNFKKGGNLYTRFVDTKNSFWVTYELDGVEISQLLPTDMSSFWSGKSSGEGKFNFNFKTTTSSSGDGTIDIKDFKMASQNFSGFLTPSLDWGDLKVKLTLKNGIVEFTQAQFGNDKTDLKGGIQGDLRLAPNMLQSYLNLTLRFQVSEALRANPKASSILAFLDGQYRSSKGDYAMKWMGTLEEIMTRAPFPQKVAD